MESIVETILAEELVKELDERGSEEKQTTVEQPWEPVLPRQMARKQKRKAAKTITFGELFSNPQDIQHSLAIRVGPYFHRSLAIAFEKKEKHEAVFQSYTATFPAAKIKEWQQDINRWDDDHNSKPDPYEEVVTSKWIVSMNV